MKNTVLLPVLCYLLLLQTPVALAWGEEGHRMVNGIAAASLPEDVPGFLRDAVARLEFLGPEPDRWRDNKEVFSALREVNAPDHFVNVDDLRNFAVLPNDRYLYGEWLRAHGKDQKAAGNLPYAILEGHQKVQVLFRQWRDAKNAAERTQIEQNIVYYAGVLGHFVADGSQPLHVSMHYNGWSDSANPASYTRQPLHGRFETEFVKAQIKPADIQPMVAKARVLKDPFSDIMNFLFDSNRQVETLYRMEQVARWDGNNRSPEARQFVSARLAAGAQMLANLWYTAWIESQ